MKNLRMQSEHVLYAEGRVAMSVNGIATSRYAITSKETLSVSLTLPRQAGVTALTLVLYRDKEGTRESFSVPFTHLLGGSDGYTFDFPQLPVGLYYYGFSAETAVGTATLRKSGHDDRVYFVPMPPEQTETPFQLTVSHFRYQAPEWLYGGIIYHIFVDRFFKVGEIPPKKGTVINPDWENGIPQYPAYPGAPLKNNMFFGGNLWGVAEKLDYLLSLSVNCLYLSPIFDAASNHKYDTGDYLTVDSMFGGETALRHLIAEAKKRNMHIIFDGVFNHTGADSLYFNRFGNYDSVGAYQSKDSPYYSWYDFQEFPNRYTSWWDIDILPRISPDTPSCRAFFTGENGVVPKWISYGIDGFRLDVADELSDDFIADIKEKMNRINPASMLYGEVWEDASNKIAYSTRRAYYQGAELDGVMNYPLRTGLISYFRNRETEALRYALTDIYQNAPKRIADAQMNLLGTHDTERILTALAGKPRGSAANDELAVRRMTKKERESGVRLLSLAYLTLATLPGVPSIFYGDEAGMEGYSDPFNRMPYPWHNVNQAILSAYRAIGKLRTQEAVYKTGDFSLLSLTDSVLLFSRTEGETACFTVINRSESESLSVTSDHALQAIYGDAGLKKKKRFTLPPLSGMVLRGSIDTALHIEV